jgi:hypothetical protein
LLRIFPRKVVAVVSTLASDEMKGRKFGTPENDKAAEYIAKEFKQNNLDYCFGDSYCSFRIQRTKRL